MYTVRTANGLKRVINSPGTQARRVDSSPWAREALLRLAANSRDACALVIVYDEYGDELRASAGRWLGKDAEVRTKAVNSILAAIARQAADYDPQCMDATKWVRQCADAETRRLRQALDETLGNSRAARGHV